MLPHHLRSVHNFVQIWMVRQSCSVQNVQQDSHDYGTAAAQAGGHGLTFYSNFLSIIYLFRFEYLIVFIRDFNSFSLSLPFSLSLGCNNLTSRK